jgi:hypothetical protein
MLLLRFAVVLLVVVAMLLLCCYDIALFNAAGMLGIYEYAQQNRTA